MGRLGKIKEGWRIKVDNEINVFISHAGKDEGQIEKFKTLMINKKGYHFKDSSIVESEPNNATNPDYIKSAYLIPSINWAGTVIVLIGKDTHKSDWVNWEIEYAMKLGKKVIGVYIYGEKGVTLPSALEDYGSACVGWDSNKIDEAIRGENPIWEDEDGNIRDDKTSSRITC